MRVTLIDYTGAPNPWRAADIMIFTKRTRTTMSPSAMVEIMEWPVAKKLEELAYMANTIRSSWEFCSYTFLLEGVTRAFTHQLVRTRHGSYAQQTQQVLKIDAYTVERHPGLVERANSCDAWDRGIHAMASAYADMLHHGATVEQARGILPTNIKTNIVCKFNLRTLVEIFDQRISPRNLGEYREVAMEMKKWVLVTHPWAKAFLEQSRDQYLQALDVELQWWRDHAPASMSERATKAMKLVDQLRRNRDVKDDEE